MRFNVTVAALSLVATSALAKAHDGAAPTPLARPLADPAVRRISTDANGNIMGGGGNDVSISQNFGSMAGGGGGAIQGIHCTKGSSGGDSECGPLSAGSSEEHCEGGVCTTISTPACIGDMCATRSAVSVSSTSATSSSSVSSSESSSSASTAGASASTTGRPDGALQTLPHSAILGVVTATLAGFIALVF